MLIKFIYKMFIITEIRRVTKAVTMGHFLKKKRNLAEQKLVSSNI